MNDPLDYCRVEGCGRKAERRCNYQQLCGAHFQRLKRTGDVMAHKPIIRKKRGINRNQDGTHKQCLLTDCYRQATSSGFCHLHWKRMSRNDGRPYAHVPAGELTTYKAEQRAEKLMRKGA